MPRSPCPDTAILRRHLAERRAGFSLAQPFYRDPMFFAFDMAGIFHRQWLFAGLDCEIAEPGAFVTLEVGPSSVIVLRDEAGAVRAFHNVCRHRGSALCDATSGRMRAIVCPYHRWHYDLAGRLRGHPNMGADFDPTGFDLKPVRVATAAGTIFVCLGDDPPDFAPFHATLEPYLLPHRLADTRLAHRETLSVRGNWKLVMENSRECDHCPAGHPELMRTLLHDYDLRDPSAHGGIRELWERCERIGLPSAVRQGHGYRVSRLPFAHGASSITMDGRSAVTRPLADLPETNIGSLRWVHFPSLFAHALADYAVLVQLMPKGPRETAMTTRWLVHRDAVEARDYALPRLTEVWSATNEQDRILIERNQRGVDGVGYEPGPYAPAGEFGVASFVDWYCAEMERFLEAR
jgi:Rieske 2Fe-2S family protein